MASLSDVEVFVRVAETGSFTGAARALGISKSHVSRRLKRLEEELGATLIARSTRKLNLTEVGRSYHERVVPVLESLQEAEREVISLQAEPRGLLRVAVPLSFGLRFLVGAIDDFMLRWPALRVLVSYDDRPVDLMVDGYDLAIRGGRLGDSTLVARRLAEFHGVVVAAPAYVGRRGAPAHPSDLARHDCLDYTGLSSLPRWWFAGPEGEVVADVVPRLSANNGDALQAAAVAGLGIAYQPDFLANEELRAGRLVRLLPGWRTWTGAIHAVYPHRRHLSAKVRLFVDFLVERLAGPPWGSPPPGSLA